MKIIEQNTMGVVWMVCCGAAHAIQCQPSAAEAAAALITRKSLATKRIISLTHCSACEYSDSQVFYPV